jgi:NAD(P)-dependent dehydrogenase (short-subunit alcohol dehydrogenase family)
VASKVCVVTGVGPGTGVACVRKFAAEGYRVAMLARSAEKLEALAAEIPGAHPYPTDVTVAANVAATFARVRHELGRVEVLIHNAGNAVFGDVLTVTAEQLEDAWRVNVLGLFLCAREAIPDMQAEGHGTILVTGATASLRGSIPMAAFAPAKGAQRLLAQSMARRLGPDGIHVALAVIDGVIDMPVTRGFLPDRPDHFFLQPSAIADAYFAVAGQDRSAWTFEFDLRPFGEKW